MSPWTSLPRRKFPLLSWRDPSLRNSFCPAQAIPRREYVNFPRKEWNQRLQFVRTPPLILRPSQGKSQLIEGSGVSLFSHLCKKTRLFSPKAESPPKMRITGTDSAIIAIIYEDTRETSGARHFPYGSALCRSSPGPLLWFHLRTECRLPPLYRRQQGIGRRPR